MKFVSSETVLECEASDSSDSKRKGRGSAAASEKSKSSIGEEPGFTARLNSTIFGSVGRFLEDGHG